MKKTKLKLNALDIVVIAAILIVILATVTAWFSGRRTPKTNVVITMVSDAYQAEVFGGIEENSAAVEGSSERNIGTIMNLQTRETEYGFIAEMNVAAKAEKLDNGISVNGIAYYKGEKFNIITADSQIVCTIVDFKM